MSRKLHDFIPLDRRTQVIVGRQRYEWYSNFHNRWKDCVHCPLSTIRNHVVQFRGIIPAKVLFVGEAPSVSDDEVGRPFVDPLLDELLTAAGLQDGDYCLVNAIGCIPHLPSSPISPPEKACITACSSRLHELVSHVRPEYVCTLGKLSSHVVAGILAQTSCISSLGLPHPARILFLQATNPKQAVIERKRFVLSLKTYVLPLLSQ
jgi:uracil-DNA glycosylase family 4